MDQNGFKDFEIKLESILGINLVNAELLSHSGHSFIPCSSSKYLLDVYSVSDPILAVGEREGCRARDPLALCEADRR